jgi:6-phosphogluconolactonase
VALLSGGLFFHFVSVDLAGCSAVSGLGGLWFRRASYLAPNFTAAVGAPLSYLPLRTSIGANMALCVFPSILAVLAMAAVTSGHAAGRAKYLVYIGTYTNHGSQGIYTSEFDPSNGHLSAPKLAAETAQPSFLAVDPNRRFLYAINELDQFNGQPTGGVSAFSIEPTTGKLDLLNQVSSRGAGPAFIALDQSGRYVLVANYTQGSVAVFRLSPDGSIGESTAFVRHQGSSVNPERQEGPHAHAILMSRDNRFAIVADLGLDELLVYPVDASRGTLGQPCTIRTDPGAGPRHLAFVASGQIVYVTNEMSSTITAYSFHPSDGAMVPIQTISLLPSKFAGTSTAAEVVLHPSSKYLYGSNRGDDSIAVFSVHPGLGTLTLIERVPTGGKTPRSFAIDPSGEWLLAANQDSNSVVTFRINRGSGRLTPTGQSIEVNSPAMVDFVEFLPLGGGK